MRLAAGFARLARMHDAAIVPILITRICPFEWSIHLGPAWRPSAAAETDDVQALDHFVEHLLPVMRRHPLQIRRETFDRIEEESAG